MAQTSHLKSTAITNLDATPSVANSAGEGAAGVLRHVQASVTAVLNDSIDTTYQFVRIPSNAKVKHLYFESGAQTAGKVDLGVYYATDGMLEHPVALLAADAIDQDFFASAIDCASAVTRADVVNESTTNTAAKRNQPLWQALGLTSDPGCLFDIVGTVVTTAMTTATGIMTVEAEYVV